MRKRFLLIIGLLTGLFTRPDMGMPQQFSKSAFYAVLKSGDPGSIDQQLDELAGIPETEKGAYRGALLMRKAGTEKKPKDRLRYFREGRTELETALHEEPENTEFHFLRLIVEENAPKIVKYHRDIPADKAIIVRNFSRLSPAVQHAVLDYSQHSSVLHRDDF